MVEVSVTRDTDVPADTLYARVADFGNVSWMKGVAKCEVTGDGPGMVRNIFVSPEAPPVVEKLTARDDAAKRIEYSIPEGNPLPIENYAAYVVVSESGAGSRIEWGCTGDAKGIDDAAAKTAVEGMYGVLIGWVVEGTSA
jgi:hypothetical protein